VQLAESVDLRVLASDTEGFTGADLQALLYNAHLDVVHESISVVESEEDSTHPRRQDEVDDQLVEYLVIGGQATTAARSRAEEADFQKRVCVLNP
jgi:peroxin-1